MNYVEQEEYLRSLRSRELRDLIREKDHLDMDASYTPFIRQQKEWELKATLIRSELNRRATLRIAKSDV
jgi:hypothetical protein